MASGSNENSKDLTFVPQITFSFVEDVIKSGSRSQGSKELTKGYKYFSEKYVSNITVHKLNDGCLVRGKCYRSQRKNESPHDVEVVLLEGPVLKDSRCTCTIGISGTCGHVTGLLYTLVQMKSSGFKSIPSDVLKTSLPQTWHVPRGDKLKGCTSDEVVLCGYDAKSPYRQPRGLKSTLYDPRRVPVPSLGTLTGSLANLNLLLPTVTEKEDGCNNFVDTRFGKFCKGSPISYQQQLSSQYILNVLDGEFPPLPQDNVMQNNLEMVLNEKKLAAYSSIIVSLEECHQIEAMTRLQSSYPKWHAIRRDRITASVAGDIIKRRADNDPLVARLKTTRKVVTESMRHGLTFEAVAANAYSNV